MLFSSENPLREEIEDGLPEMIEKISYYLN